MELRILKHKLNNKYEMKTTDKFRDGKALLSLELLIF